MVRFEHSSKRRYFDTNGVEISEEGLNCKAVFEEVIVKKVFRKIWWWLTWRCIKCGRETIAWGHVASTSCVCPIHGLMPLMSEEDYPLKEKLSLEQRVVTLEEATAEAERQRAHRLELRRWGV